MLSGEDVAPDLESDPTYLAQPIAGVVTTSDHRPIPGAKVSLSTVQSRAGAESERALVTDAAGRFRFAVAANAYDVRVQAPGRVSVLVPIDTRLPVAATLEVSLDACDRPFLATVTDEQHHPLAGAVVEGDRGARALTDDKGQATLCLPLRSWGNVHATKLGYAPTYRFYAPTAGPLVFELHPERIVTGTVLGTDGKPAKGAFVALTPVEGIYFVGAVDTVVVTDRHGAFVAHGLVPGAYGVRAYTAHASSPDATPITIGQADVRDIHLRLSPTFAVRGWIVLRDGTPVPGATVLLRRNGADRAVTFTHPDGSFTIRVKPGRVHIRVGGHEVVSSSNPVVIDHDVHDVSIEVRRLGVVCGSVTMRERPMPFDSIYSDGYQRAWTDLRGRFALSGVTPGKRSVYGMDYRHPTEVEVPRTGAAQVELHEDPTGAIGGTVVDPRGVPVPYVFVSVGGSHERRTDKDGGFWLADLPYGDYSPEVYMGGTSHKVRWLPLDSGHPRIRFTIDEHHPFVTGLRIGVAESFPTLSGKVSDARGRPAAGTSLWFVALGDHATIFSRYEPAQFVTDDQGRFAQRLARGTYAIIARDPLGASAVMESVDVGDDPPAVSLELVDPGVVTGTIHFRQPPTRVYARTPREDLSPGWWLKPGLHVFGGGTGIVDAEGHFEIAGLAPGHYRIEANSDGEFAHGEVDVAAGKVTTAAALESAGTGAVRGRLLDYDTQRPIAGARCSASQQSEQGGATEEVTTDDDGTFFLPFVAAGEVVVSCHATRLEQGTWPMVVVELADGAESAVSLRMLPRPEFPQARRVSLGFELETRVARVRSVDASGAAAKGGVAIGDLVVAINGEDVRDLGPDGIRALLMRHVTGTPIDVTFERRGKQFVVELPLVEPPRPPLPPRGDIALLH